LTTGHAHRITISPAGDGVILAMWPNEAVADHWPLAFRHLSRVEAEMLLQRLGRSLRPARDRAGHDPDLVALARHAH